LSIVSSSLVSLLKIKGDIMAYDWKNITQQQLQGQPLLNGPTGMNALATMNPSQQLRTGKNPNPQFPRARNAWENIKEKGGHAALGGAGGAATGAAIGSMFPVIGTTIGAGVGGLGGILAGLLAPKFSFGEEGGVEQHSNMTPEQQSIIQYLMQLSHEGLQNPYEGFDPIAQQARTQFSQETVPGLAERFTSMGNNALSSGAFTSQLNQGRAGLEADLSAQRAQYGQQNKQQMIQTLLSLLQPRSENIYRPRQAGAFENLAHTGLKNADKLFDIYQKSRKKDLEPKS
jgi:hypothetical protein